MPSERTEQEARSIAAIAYVLGPVTGIACILLFRDDPYIRFHGWQSLLFGTLVLVAVVALEAVPLLGLGMVFLLFVGSMLLLAMLVWQAFRGRWFLLPLIGDVALELAQRGEPKD